VQTIPGKGWFTFFRLYGPLEPWFDKTWKPGQQVEAVSEALSAETLVRSDRTDLEAAYRAAREALAVR